MEFYWRRNVREALARLAEVSKTRSEWSPFSEFCDLMEQSLRKMDQDLRKQAFAKLAEFVASASVWEFERRREFVSCILEFYYIWGLGFAHPLKVQVIFPTLQQWREKEPENAEPSRWEGVLRHDRTLLAKAIGLCPGDQVARTELVGFIVYDAWGSVHELPVGLLGSPDETLADLAEAERLLEGVQDGRVREEGLEKVRAIKSLLTSYIDYKLTSAGMCFAEWAKTNNRPASLREQKQVT